MLLLDRFKEVLQSDFPELLTADCMVAYSGGADSTCLVHLCKRAGLSVVAAHLHHGQRVEADGELANCSGFAESLEIPFVSGRADVPTIAKLQKIGLEEAGREARLEFLVKAATQTSCTSILTAHTADDQAETVIFRLARGTGIAGLAGIPARRGPFRRPLLRFSREETRAYCETHGLWFHDDPANSDIQFSRARIRSKIVPELVAINPRAVEAIARLAAQADEEDRYLDGIAAHFIESCETPVNGALDFITESVDIGLRRSAFLAAPMVIKRRALRLIGEYLGSDSIDRAFIEKWNDIIQAGEGSIDLPGNTVRARTFGDKLVVSRIVVDEPFRFNLTVPGETVSDVFGWQIVAETSGDRSLPVDSHQLTAKVDARKLKGALYFRSLTSDDEMHRVNSPGVRNVTELLKSAQLSANLRRRIPVICDMLGIVWVPGIGIDSRVMISEDTEHVLCLRLERAMEDTRHNQ